MDKQRDHPMEQVLEELTLDECCSTISDQDVPLANKFSLILTLAAKFNEFEDLTEDKADSILNSFPDGLVAELLCEHRIDAVQDYRRLFRCIVLTLLSSCSDPAFAKFHNYLQQVLRSMLSAADHEEFTPELLESFVPVILRSSSTVCRRDHFEAVSSMLSIFGFSLKKNVSELPPVDLLSTSMALINLLETLSPEHSLEEIPLPQWITDYRIVIMRILRSPPHRVRDDFRKTSFTIIDDICRIYGPRFFEGDVKMLNLVAHLVSGQLRIVLDKPDTIDSLELVTCLSIMEMCVRCVESEEFVEDSDALIISRAVKESASFVIDYWAQVMQTEEKISIEVQVVLYRFVCIFLVIGGAQMLGPGLLDAICPYLHERCRGAIENKDLPLARLFINVLDQLPVLQASTVQVITDFLDMTSTENNEVQQQCINQVLDSLDVLVERKDWYSQDSLKKGLCWAKSFKNDLLLVLFKSLRC